MLRVFGYVEPGRTTAAANGVRERFFFQSGGGTPLFPGLPHRFASGCRRTFFVFGLFSGHPSIKNCENIPAQDYLGRPDRKSTRLNSSHANISYAVFCL